MQLFQMLQICSVVHIRLMNISHLRLAHCIRTFNTAVKNNMRLLQFISNGVPSVGVEAQGGAIINLTSNDSNIPNNMVDFLKGGEETMNIAKKLSSSSKHVVQKSDFQLLPPVTNCEKVVCVGMNYKNHCLEQNAPMPEEPVIFNKFPSTIVGDGDNILLPKLSNSVDWEVELVVVIGKRGKNIKEDHAMDYVAGYTVANDVSAREWQMQKNGNQWLLGKTFDTFCPIGPVLVTKDEITDPENLDLKCTVNGNTVQSSNTNQLLFGIASCISWISRICTLKPGDILLTGTPPGVGAFRKPPVYLKAGDEVVCEIEKIGKITNTCVQEE